MQTTPVTSRMEMLVEAVKRLRQHFGNRLTSLYLLRTDPFEPQPGDEHLHLVVILDPMDDFFAEGEVLHEVLYDVAEACGAHTWIDGHLARPDSELAAAAEAEGVRL